ncbi:gluconokinase [Urechidicola croceus]|uniref:Gluconokinase n=1 Tax=Urechidicola croceus TaxID=1850246 RepID=A0A1D8P571_9FLAO|nr:gluconokinase [Urechidicola croceus]AOW19728.1 gluconate kinase [Urechidicola croceus]
MIYIVIGVSGVGKTTIAKGLASKLKIPFFDADDFHPKHNVEKMKRGFPLNDDDRVPWLEILANKTCNWNRGQGAVLACSALKEKYRQIIQGENKDVVWIFLNANFKVISDRLKARENHFMNPKLLQSQFDTLEIPKYGIHVDVNQSIDDVLREILEKNR